MPDGKHGTQSKGRPSAGKSARARLLGVGENLIGTAGALLVTFAACYVLAMGVLWIAGRLISTGGGGGTLPTAVIALVLTVIVYLYDRNNA
jgi:hypothetical protein